MGNRVACALCGCDCTWWAQWPGLPLGTAWSLYLCYEDQTLTVVAPDRAMVDIDQLDFHERKFDSGPKAIQQKLDGLDRLVDELRFWLGEPGARVAELGAGRAGISAALARRGYDVGSSEPSELMVGQARSDFGLDERQLQALTAQQHLALMADASLDAIIMWHVLEHVDTPLDIAREVRRVLRARGCFVLQMPIVAPEALFAAHRFVVLPHFPEALARRLDMAVSYVAVDLERLFLTTVLSVDDTVRLDDRRPADLPLTGMPADMAAWLAASRLQDVRWQQEVPQ